MVELINNKEKKFIVVKLKQDNKLETLKSLGNILHSYGYVKDTFTEAVCKREEVFPTGLPTDSFGIAIPHTDSLHVNEKAMIIAILDNPIEFTIMATDDEQIDVNLIFMLAIKEPEKQLEMLQNLMELCQNNEILHTIKNHKEIREIDNIISNIM